MAQYRISTLALMDLSHILATSTERWGHDASSRYATLLRMAMQKVATNPKHPASRDRSSVLKGIRSFHIRHVADAPVKNPVHVIYYRTVNPALIEIVAVLHERMEPGRHLRPETEGS
jgi:toxin ParE1/3/4